MQKWQNLRLQTCLGIGLGYHRSISQTGLVHQAQTRLMGREPGSCLHHRLIEVMRPLTTTEYQEMQFSISLSRLCRADSANLLTHRCAGILHEPTR
jgi:hypothetical protein